MDISHPAAASHRIRRPHHLACYSFIILCVYLVIKVGLMFVVTTPTVNPLKQYFDAVNGDLKNNIQSPTIKLLDVTSVSPTMAVLPINGAPCTSPHLGVPPVVLTRCRASNRSTESCAMLTCANLIAGYPLGQRDRALYRSAVDLFPEGRDIGDERKEHGNQTAIGRHADLDMVDQTSTADKCVQFRRHRGFVDLVDPEAADFPIAYNVLLHADSDQAARLLRAIYRPNNAYCLHVDAKSPDHFRSAIQSIAACFDNVRLATRPVHIVYEGYSRLQADINCMVDNINSSVKWKYLINTAGQAFPLRTVEETVRILKIYNGSNDVEGIYGQRVIPSRYEIEWIELAERGKIRTTGRKHLPVPHGLNIVRGSAYGVFSRRFVEFLLTDQRATDLLDWSRRTYSPDEMYWATLHHAYANPDLHAPGSYHGYPSSKPWLAVYVNWGDHGCEGRYVRGYCVFGVGDLPNLVTRRELFANKFYPWFQPIALDCLDQWIRHKEVCPPTDDDLDYYRQLPFIIR